jgi:hypothetical protein
MAMSPKFKFSIHQPLTWPKKCAVCGLPANSTYKAYGGSFEGFSFRIIYSKISYSKMYVSFPICSKHKYVNLILRFLMFVSFGGIIIFGIGLLSLSFFLDHNNDVAPSLLLFLLSIIFFIVSLKFQPVRLRIVGSNHFVIVIKNDQYAKEFSYLNNFQKAKPIQTKAI